jgi:hypothetical protein
MTDMIVHNNVVFTSEEYDAGATITVVQHGSWGGAWPIHTAYYNNIFLTQGAQARYSLGSSLNNAFENNLYEGATAYSRPSDPNPVTGDPLFVARKTTPGWPGLEGFELQITSPAIGQGRIVEGAPESDFFGNAVPTTGPIDVGVHQFSSPTGFERLPASPHPDAPVVYPNPARGSVTLAFSTPRAGMASLTLFDLLGRQVASWEEVLTTGTNRIALDLTHRNLPAGLYHITVEDDGPAVRSAELILIGGGDNTR